MHDIYARRNKMLAVQKEPFLMGYLLAGYPTVKEFLKIERTLETSQLDILEIGFPSKNPYADGQIIADAHRHVDYDAAVSIGYWKKIRALTDKPVWIMAYNDDFIGTGYYRELVQLELIDGIVIPDASLETRKRLQEELKDKNVDVIGFTNPDMTDRELDSVLPFFNFVYEQLYVGHTGEGKAENNHIHMIEYTLSKYPYVIPFAGFGVNTKEKLAQAYKEGFKGAVIGTELIRRLNISCTELLSFLKTVGRAKEAV
jgi:tryptophan synthase alpha chain